MIAVGSSPIAWSQAVPDSAMNSTKMHQPRSIRWPVFSRTGAAGGADAGCFVWTAIVRSGYPLTAPYPGGMLVPLTNAPRDYAWGSTTLIADLEGRAPSGRPEAEVWFGDHPGCPAHVTPDGRTLGAVARRRGRAPPARRRGCRTC